MKTYTVKGYYGSANTPCEIYVYEKSSGLKWYVVDGGEVVNATYDDIELGCNVELLSDEYAFTWSDPITSEEELVTAVEF